MAEVPKKVLTILVDIESGTRMATICLPNKKADPATINSNIPKVGVTHPMNRKVLYSAYLGILVQRPNGDFDLVLESDNLDAKRKMVNTPMVAHMKYTVASAYTWSA